MKPLKTFKKRKTINLSGEWGDHWGDDYREDIYQIMLSAGVRWIRGKDLSIWTKRAIFSPKEYLIEGKGLKKKYLEGKNGLRAAMSKELGEASHEFLDMLPWQVARVISHLHMIHEIGRKKWLKKIAAKLKEKGKREDGDFEGSLIEWPHKKSELRKK